MRKVFMLLVLMNAIYFAWHELVPVSSVIGEARPQHATAIQGVRSVALLKERGSPVNQLAIQALPERAVVQRGLQLGGFATSENIRALEQRLLTLGIRADLVQTEQEVETEYWVYMAPLASRAASLRQLRELQARKLDGFLITQGELENGISLGIFQNEALAQGMLERMRSAGYSSQIKQVARKQSIYWLKIDPESMRLVDEKLLQRLAVDFAGLQHQVIN